MKELFLIILKQAVNASWIILAVLLARALTRRSAKWTRNILWALVAVRLILPFSLESPVSLVPTWQQPTVQTVDSAPSEPEQPTSATVTVQVPNRVTGQTDAPAPSAQPVVDHGTQQNTAPVQQDTPAPSAPPVAEQQSAEPVQRGALSPVDVAGAVWMIGAVLMLLYNIVCHLRLRRRIRDAVLAPDGVWESEWLNSGVVVGYLRPRVCLPFGIEPSVREHIVAHERAHIRRGDHLTKMFAYLLLAVFWFHPLVWVAYYLFCRDVELACDERVIRGLDDAGVRAYARALLSYGSANRTTAAAAQPAFAQTSVKTRLQHIVNYKKPTVWVIALTMVVCVVTAACFLTVQKPVNVSAIEPDPVGATDAPVAPVTQPSTEETTDPEPTSTPEPVVEPQPVTDPEPEPVDEPVVDPEPVDEPEPEKHITIRARDTMLEGEAVNCEVIDRRNDYYIMNQSFTNTPDIMFAQIENGAEYDNRCKFTILVARSVEEFNDQISLSKLSKLYDKYNSMLYKESDFEYKKYNEDFFQKNLLIILLDGGVVESITKYDNELCINAGTTVRRPELTLPAMEFQSLSSIVIRKADFLGIDTISFFVRALN